MYAYLRMKWNIARGFKYEIKNALHPKGIELALKSNNLLNRKPWQPLTVFVQVEDLGEGKKIASCQCGE